MPTEVGHVNKRLQITDHICAVALQMHDFCERRSGTLGWRHQVEGREPPFNHHNSKSVQKENLEFYFLKCVNKTFKLGPCSWAQL